MIREKPCRRVVAVGSGSPGRSPRSMPSNLKHSKIYVPNIKEMPPSAGASLQQN